MPCEIAKGIMTSSKSSLLVPAFYVDRSNKEDYTCCRVKTEYILKTLVKHLIILKGANTLNKYNSRYAEEGEYER